jgi:hypothetical protein
VPPYRWPRRRLARRRRCPVARGEADMRRRVVEDVFTKRQHAGSLAWHARRVVVRAKSTAAGERLGEGEIQPRPPRIPVPPAVVDLAVPSPSHREPQARCFVPVVCSGPSSAWAHHAHDTYPLAGCSNDGAEEGGAECPRANGGGGAGRERRP